MKKIGIIGRGFVGSAVEFGFSAQTGCDAEVRVYDKDPTKSTHTLEETVNESDVIFISSRAFFRITHVNQNRRILETDISVTWAKVARFFMVI